MSDTKSYQKEYQDRQLSAASKTLIRSGMLDRVKEFHRLQGWVGPSPAAGYLAGMMLNDLGGLAAAW